MFQNEALRKKYKSFYYTNNEFENILNLMDKMQIKSDIYFSIIPGVADEENIKSESYGKYLKEKYKYINEILLYPLELEMGSALFENPEKYNIQDKKKTFKDYMENKGKSGSFENI